MVIYLAIFPLGTPPLPQKDNADKLDLTRTQSDSSPRIRSRSRAFIKKSMIDESEEDTGHSPPSPRGVSKQTDR